MKNLLLIALLALLALVRSVAFPPAPDHVLYGQVRDEFGNPLLLKSAEVYLETSAGIRLKTQILSGLEPGSNYRLSIPMDSGLTSDRYIPTALQSAIPFKMWVSVDGTKFLPIEMKLKTSALGRPGEKTRIDLTLGEDSDGNGLPDAWERALLAAWGGELSVIRPGDDLDGDGMSNLDEYLAGTYAFDSRDGLSVKVVEVSGGGAAALEFLAIRGRSYSVFGSHDLQEWTQIQFRVAGNGADTSDRGSYLAEDSRMVRVSVQPSTEPAMRFFKLRME